MLINNLKIIVEQAKRNNQSIGVIRNLLKEVLQYYVLGYIYSSFYSKKLIFTGGSCLRVCYNLNRLSEDLDFDLSASLEINKKQLTRDLLQYFKSDLQYQDIEANIAGQGKKIYLKFPILDQLGLAEKQNQMKKLFVKIEIDKNTSKNYQIDLTPIARYNFNFLVRSYNLATLMANKIVAVLSRTWQKTLRQSSGQVKNRITFKGRDYYDLLWFLQQGIKPNMDRIKDLTGIRNKKELTKRLNAKIDSVNTNYLKEDIINLFEDARFVKEISDNYQFLVKKYLKNL